MAVLAAIVAVAVQGLIAPGDFLRVWRVSRSGAGIAAITLKLPVEKLLKAAGFLDEDPLLRLYRTEADVLQAQWEN